MGLLDQAIGRFAGSGEASEIECALTNMLGGEANGGSGASGKGSDGAGGSLDGLMAKFRSAGLGHIIQSWVSDGPNKSVTSEQLHSVLGDDKVQSIAGQAGMEPRTSCRSSASTFPMSSTRRPRAVETRSTKPCRCRHGALSLAGCFGFCRSVVQNFWMEEEAFTRAGRPAGRLHHLECGTGFVDGDRVPWAGRPDYRA